VLSQQEISDRLEIQDLLTAYSHALDRRRWDDLDALFTPDAVVDYTATGAIRGTVAELKAYLEQVMPMMVSYQHLVGTTALEISGDVAEGRTICFNPMVIDMGPDKGPRVFLCGLWYRDRFQRTPDGWRIAERVEELSYFHNFPAPDGKPPGAADFGFPA
jgi:hypothetical protein